MTMANLIKRIAVSTSRKNNNTARVAHEFNSSDLSTSGARSRATANAKTTKSNTFIELTNCVFNKGDVRNDTNGRVVSFEPKGDQITVTKDIRITSDPAPGNAGVIIYAGEDCGENEAGLKPGDGRIVGSKSFDDLTEGGSVRSEGGRSKGDSDDEELLDVKGKKGSWHRLAD